MFNLTRSGNKKFVAPHFNIKQPGIRIMKYNTRAESHNTDPQSPIIGSKLSDFLTIRASGTQQNFHHKKSLTLTNQRIVRSPTTDTYVNKIHNNNNNVPVQQDSFELLNPKSRLTFQGIEAVKAERGQFFVDVSGSNFEEETTECTHNTQIKQGNSTLASTTKAKIMNFSTSMSSQNTLISDPFTPLMNPNEEHRLTNFTNGSRRIRPLRHFNSDQIKIEPSHNQRNFKAAERISEAKEKAKLYNDQAIKQHQFNRDDEEEEQNFLELCGVLNTHL